MTTQDNVGALVTYGAETTIGTPATAGGTSQRLRRITSGLALSKAGFASKEVRPDFQVGSVRHGARSVAGPITGELSLQTHDDFWEAIFRNSWVAGVSADQSDFTSLTISGGVITAGGGSFLTKGFKIGQIVDFGGLSVTANNIRARITALTATTMATYPVLADNGADTSCTITVVGKTLLLGTAKHQFSFEHNFPDKDMSKLFIGCRLNGASVNIPPTDNAQVSFDVMGLNQSANLTGASAPYFTSPTAAPIAEVHTGLDGGIRLGGVEQAIITGLSFNIAHNMSMGACIGTGGVSPDVFYGQIVVTGQVTAYLDKTIADLFLNETIADLVFAANASGVAPQGFLAWNMQNVKLMGASEQLESQGGVISQHPFQATIKAGGAGTAYDQSTISMQRSNS